MRIITSLKITTLSFAFAVFCLSLFQRFLEAPNSDWNYARLSATVGLFWGDRIYQGEHIIGPHYSFIYPPMGFIAYLPCMLFDDPIRMILAAFVVVLVLLIVPVAILFFTRTESRYDRLDPLLRLAFFISFLLWSRPLTSILAVRVDAPAIFFAALAGYFLINARSWTSLILSSLCAALSVWCKQTVFPLLFVLPLSVYLSLGYGIFKKYLCCISLSLILVSAVFLVFFQPSDLFFNLITIPANQPWMGQPLTILYDSVSELTQYCFVPAIIFVIFLLSLRGQRIEAKKYIKQSIWIVFLTLAILMIPSNFFSRVKVGGALNSWSYTIYFFVLAVSLLPFKINKDNPGIHRAVFYFLIALHSYQILGMLHISQAINQFNNNSTAQLYKYMISHPGEVYCPTNPLLAQIAEKKRYHFVFDLKDRDWANYPVSESEFNSAVPKTFNKVVYTPFGQHSSLTPTQDLNNDTIMRHLPEFRKRVAIDELPGFLIFER